VNDAGAIVFDARIGRQSGVPQGVYIKRSTGTLDVIARTGDPSPVAGTTFHDFAPPP
jgi:hypothetical protein